MRYAIVGLCLIAAISLIPAAGWSQIEQSIITLPGQAVTNSSPAVADIDGIPSNGAEIAVAGKDGILHVARRDGTVVWSQSLPSSTCATDQPKLYSSPAVGNLLGNGVPYVVVGFGNFTSSCDGGVAAFRGSDGVPLFVFSLKKFAKQAKFSERIRGVYGTPALADTDGDGTLEIGFGAFDRNVYLLNARGTVRFFYHAADTVWSSPAFGDADGDGRLELVIGTDISQNKALKPPTPNGGYLYALRTLAGPKKSKGKFNFRDSKAVMWATAFDQTIMSAPIIADVIPEERGPEVIVGSGCYFPEGDGDRRGKWYKVVSLRTGAVLRTLETTACSPASPAAADLDGDGVPEVVTLVNGASNTGGDGQSRVIAWNARTGTKLWETVPRSGGNRDGYGGDFGRTPVIADLDGNGTVEVIVAHSNGIVVLNGLDGTHVTCEERACGRTTLRAPSVLYNTPAVADLDLDGVPELVAAGASGGTGAIITWSGLADELVSNGPVVGAPFLRPWSAARGGTRRAGRQE